MADHVADSATDFYGKDLIDIARWLHVGSSRYATLMLNISEHIAESYFVHRELTAKYESVHVAAQPNKDSGNTYQALAYPERRVSDSVGASH